MGGISTVLREGLEKESTRQAGGMSQGVVGSRNRGVGHSCRHRQN